MDRHRGLAVLEGRELLRARDGNRRVARNDLLDEAAHRLDAERQRNHVEQQPVVAAAAIAREQIRLDRRAERDDLVRIEIDERRLAEILRDRVADHRHARRAADEHDALDVGRAHLRVAQRLASGPERALHERLDERGERVARDRLRELLARRQLHVDTRLRRGRQRLLRAAHAIEQQAHVLGRERGRLEARLREHVLEQQVIEIVAAERGIAARREHFEHALRELQNRQIERAAAEVIDRIEALRAVVEPVCDRGRGRLVQQAQHVQPREPRGVLRRLALRIVEIRGHRDDRADEVVAERILGALPQRRENFRRYLDRALHAVDRADLHHAGRIDEFVWRVRRALDFRLAPPHEALDRHDRVARIDRRLFLRGMADPPAALVQIADDGGQQHAPRIIGQCFRNAVAHRRDERIRRAEVDADGEAPLMRRGRHAGFGNLQ
ncbi:NAD-specific glutamate dehydrogenase [Burkholderia pseudomallei]|nr:NAD-specific glutamate dehydrogenase [Burkholderia pseudomallei]